MFRIASYAGIVLACCILATPSFAEELVANGGFETGNFSGWIASPAPSGSDLSVNHNHPHSGTSNAQLAATGTYDDSIMQSLTTIQGQSYKIDFWLSHPYDYINNDFSIYWDSTPILSLTPAGYFGYTKYSFTEVASGPSAIIRFSGREMTAYFYLDDVSVQPVPEPAILVLFSAGVFAFLAFVCRKWKRAA
jgi:hypothetical protein